MKKIIPQKKAPEAKMTSEEPLPSAASRFGSLSEHAPGTLGRREQPVDLSQLSLLRSLLIVTWFQTSTLTHNPMNEGLTDKMSSEKVGVRWYPRPPCRHSATSRATGASVRFLG